MSLMDDANDAVKFSIHNRAEINDDTKCGCYFCLRVCIGSEIEEWVDISCDTAICPHCNIDSLLPNITDENLLQLAHEKYFTGKSNENNNNNAIRDDSSIL